MPENSLTANKDKGISKKFGLKPLFFGAGLSNSPYLFFQSIL